jgi:hypothetical protein
MPSTVNVNGHLQALTSQGMQVGFFIVAIADWQKYPFSCQESNSCRPVHAFTILNELSGFEMSD